MTKPHKPGQACRQTRQQPSRLEREQASGVVVDAFGNDAGTVERAQHDREPRAIVETRAGGQRARAVRDTDTIGRLLGNRTITLDMARAARRFHRAFHTAALDQLHAAPMERLAKGRTDDTRVMNARERVWKAIKALGGHGTPAANAVWFVVGCRLTIKEWARRERFGHGGHLDERCARGILIGALSCLQDAHR